MTLTTQSAIQQKLKQKQKPRKRKRLRYFEYYDVQTGFDTLYDKSKQGQNFKSLMPIICSDNNIELAYRTIKRNHGSKTKGVNASTIETIAEAPVKEIIDYVRTRLANYQPQAIRRVEIPKRNGKLRPLGIPTIEDRLIQQCIKQVLEPIVEAKFYDHSYGFRANRSCKDAIAYFSLCINKSKLYHVVDMDIKGFFDNVDHGKLLKQLWTMGIRDKQLICIISKMLKAEIVGLGTPDKGTPQGGILSPLLANVVLNELDWWIHSQWMGMQTKQTFNEQFNKSGSLVRSNIYASLRRSKLKEVKIVRYADDFKILCRTHEDAVKIYHAVQQWLRERLHLEISPEKSKIVDIRKTSSDFLGFTFFGYHKGSRNTNKEPKWVIRSHVDKANQQRIKEHLKAELRAFRHNQDSHNVLKINAYILGVHQYYKAATECSIDFRKIQWLLRSLLDHLVKGQSNKNKSGSIGKSFQKFYGGYKGKIWTLNNVALYPIGYIQHETPMVYSQRKSNYTAEGRALLHKDLELLNYGVMRYILMNPLRNESIELNDNRISLFAGQRGCCFITGQLLMVGNMELHHKKARADGGDDSYNNLVWLCTEAHKLIHATKRATISYYLKLLELDARQINKVNKLRELVGNSTI